MVDTHQFSRPIMLTVLVTSCQEIRPLQTKLAVWYLHQSDLLATDVFTKGLLFPFGSCSYPTQKLETWKEAAWKCYTMALEEISISTTRVGRIYWLYGADANYGQHDDVVRVQARQIKISILGTYVTSHQASSRSRWLSRDKLMTHMPVKANEVFYYKQPRNKSSVASCWIELHLLLTSIDSKNRHTEIG